MGSSNLYIKRIELQTVNEKDLLKESFIDLIIRLKNAKFLKVEVYDILREKMVVAETIDCIVSYSFFDCKFPVFKLDLAYF